MKNIWINDYPVNNDHIPEDVQQMVLDKLNDPATPYREKERLVEACETCLRLKPEFGWNPGRPKYIFATQADAAIQQAFYEDMAMDAEGEDERW